MKIFSFVLCVFSLVSATTFAADCSHDVAEKESQELKSSPYWKAKVDEMMKLLNEERSRGCGSMANEKTNGLDIVSDDIEFIGSDANRMFSQSLGYTECSKSKENYLGVYPSNEGFLKGKSQVRIATPKGSLNFLANTCSPKEVVANFIPTAKMALQAACGQHGMGSKEADIKIQTEAYGILNGAKAEKKAGATK